MPNHIHLFISTTPTVALTDVVRTLKSISARKLFKRFPKLKVFYNRSGSLWSKGYFVSSIGKRKRRNSSKVHTRTKKTKDKSKGRDYIDDYHSKHESTQKKSTF